MKGKVQLIKVIYGKKGSGKTKKLIDTANALAGGSKGDVVFIDDSNQLMYDLKHQVRFVNVSEFPIKGEEGFFGFLCGMISANYDIGSILIDGLTYIVEQKIGTLENFFKKLDYISSTNKIDFYISINGEPDVMPGYVRNYI